MLPTGAQRGRGVNVLGFYRGKKAITAEFAVELEGALGIPANVWMSLEANYRLVQGRLEGRGRPSP